MASRWPIRAALAAVALVAYANSFGLGMAGDSRVIVAEDARIQTATAANLQLIFTKDYWWPKPGDLIYRPVTTASYLVNWSLLGNGPHPAGYHWVNFLLHVLNVCLVYELALLLLARPAPAFLAAALWAVHPIGTEAVDNIVGRADLLAAAAVLTGLLLFLRTTGRQRSASTAVALFTVATLGVLAKENAAVLVGLMVLSDVAFSAPLWTRMRDRLALYLAAVASLVVLFAARAAVFASLPQPQTIYLDNILRSLDFWQARFTALKVIGLDLWLLVCPLHLASDRSFRQVQPAGWGDVAAWAAVVAVGAILALAVALRRRAPLAFWLAGFFAVALLPTSNLILLIGSTMAERFLYLPSIAFALALAALAWRYLPPRTATATLAALLLLYTGRTWARNADWRDNLTLGVADTRTAPQSVRLHDMLAKAWFEQDSQRNIDRAIAEGEKAWDILRPVPAAQSSELPPARLGIYYAVKAGMLPPAEARLWYEKSIATLERAREISQVAEKAFDDAQLAHGKPLAARQAFSLIYLYLANDYLSLARYPEALEALRYARALNPRFPDLYDAMAGAYQGTGNPRAAALSLEQKALVQGAPLASPADFCPAAAELAQAYRDNRSPDRVLEAQLASRCAPTR